MEFKFWKQISVLDAFLIALNGVLLLLLFTSTAAKTRPESSYSSSAPTTVEPSPTPELAWAADDWAFIAAMMAP